MFSEREVKMIFKVILGQKSRIRSINDKFILNGDRDHPPALVIPTFASVGVKRERQFSFLCIFGLKFFHHFVFYELIKI